MDQADGMNAHFWGVEAVPYEIMAKHCVLRRMSDFRQNVNEEVAFSRTIPSNQVHNLHQNLPMDATDGMEGYFWGVEAKSRKIMAKHRRLRQMSDFGPILDEEVAFSCIWPSNQVHHLHHDPPMDQTE